MNEILHLDEWCYASSHARKCWKRSLNSQHKWSELPRHDGYSLPAANSARVKHRNLEHNPGAIFIPLCQLTPPRFPSSFRSLLPTRLVQWDDNTLSWPTSCAAPLHLTEGETLAGADEAESFVHSSKFVEGRKSKSPFVVVCLEAVEFLYIFSFFVTN